MEKNTLWLKLWAFGLALALIITTYLTIAVNPVEIAVLYLGVLAIVAGIGLVTNVMGGSIAAVVAVFAMVLINQFSGIYPRESLFINVATELVAVLMVGPLAGRVSTLVDRIYRRGAHWRSVARKQAAHDESLGTLKPKFTTIRLNEEILRAKTFNRPLSVITLDIIPRHAPKTPAEMNQILQTMVRVARSLTKPPTVIACTGENQIALILPEYTAPVAAELSHKLMSKVAHAPFFAENTVASLGNPVSSWGNTRAGVATLNGQPETGEALLKRAQTALKGEIADV